MLLFLREGANFSWSRRHNAIAQLRSTGGFAPPAARCGNRTRCRRAAAAPRLRRGGRRAANVLVLAHRGFCADGRVRPSWHLPTHRQLLIHTVLIPATFIPP